MLFDPTPPSRLTNKVFSTEGHPLYLPSRLLKPPAAIRRSLIKGQDLYCPAYSPPTLGGGLVVGIERRRDYEYARRLVFGPGVDGRVEERGQVWWWEGGWCEIPKAPKFVSLSEKRSTLPHILLLLYEPGRRGLNCDYLPFQETSQKHQYYEISEN